MATIVNIFGKLYTLMRRGQPDPAPANVDENETRTDTVTSDDARSTSDVEECQEAYSSDLDEREQVVINKGLDKCMTESTVSSDWEHIPDVSRDVEKTKDGSSQHTDLPEILLNGSTLSGTDVDVAYLGSSEVGQSEGIKVKETCNDENTREIPATDSEKDKNKGVLENKVDDARQGAKSHKQDGENKKVNESKRGKGKKVCKYYKRGQKCWKGDNCKFVHSREQQQQDIRRPVKSLDEKNFNSYLNFVCASTEEGVQINSKDLFYKLGFEKGVEVEEVGAAVLGQYQLAKGRNNWSWVKEARYYAELFFAPDWIDRNLPHRDIKSNRKNRPSKKSKPNLNEHFESPTGLCRDFRLKENPSLEVVSANAAGDSSRNAPTQQSLPSVTGHHGDDGTKTTGKPTNVDDFVTDYTEEIIQKAMKMALDDGLSESAIMEVIEDVTSVDQISTPPKHSKPTKLDINRTPKRKRDQLALGFNYHSDLVIQQSPKTVRGEIIPLDSLHKPRERPEELAISFNYLAEQLVKNSPRTETGEVIIEGVTTTPRRMARDHLAVGFNYHSDQVIKQSPKTVHGEIIPITTLQKPRQRPEELAVSFNYLAEQLVKNSPRTEKGEVIIEGVTTTPRRMARDHLAVGFNYHSDQIAKHSSPPEKTENEKAIDIIAINQENDSRTLLSENNKYHDNVKSTKRSISDTFAVGFSYNSDQIMKESLDEINGNLPNDNIVASLIEDAVIGEGRNMVEVIDETPAIGLLAGNVLITNNNSV